MEREQPQTGEQGAALLTAIFYTLIIALLATSIITGLHLRTLKEVRLTDRMEAELLAKTARSFGVLLVANQSKPGTDEASDSRRFLRAIRCESDEGIFGLKIEDEAGKIDLNTGPLSLLEAYADELGQNELYERVRDLRARGELLTHINDVFPREDNDQELLDLLGRTVTVYSRLPGVDLSEMSVDARADALRSAVQRVPGALLDSPARVFRFDISVRMRGGLEYGRTDYIRLARDGASYDLLESFSSSPRFEIVAPPFDEVCEQVF